jgi:hypothetical protein
MIPFDTLMAYEGGELEFDDVVDMFQTLVDSGLVWQLQGSYGRTAAALIASGDVVLPGPR